MNVIVEQFCSISAGSPTRPTSGNQVLMYSLTSPHGGVTAAPSSAEHRKKRPHRNILMG